MLTGIKDLDREILSKVPDDELLKTCTVDKRFWNEVCNDNFLRRRLLSKYPGIEKYKSSESWKQFFLSTTFYTSKMKEDYEYEYTSGDFKKQYQLLKKFHDNFDSLMDEAIQQKEYSLLFYIVEKGIDQRLLDITLYMLAVDGNLEMVKYLIKKGADINSNMRMPLRMAVRNGHYNLVKYLVENGALIPTYILTPAITRGNFDIVKYLVEKKEDINSEELNDALEQATENKSYNIVKYLQQFKDKL